MDTPTSLYASTHTYQCNYPAAALNLARTSHTDIWVDEREGEGVAVEAAI